jgi:hypothetical protein
LSEIERLPLPLSGQSEASEDEIQLLGYEVVTRTTSSGVAADVTLFVCYNFSSEYNNGSPLSFTFTNEYVTSNSGAGGGGGGGTQHSISPGLGTTEFTFSFETTSWERLQDWLENVTVQIDCCTTAGGEQVMIGQIYKVGFVSTE